MASCKHCDIKLKPKDEKIACYGFCNSVFHFSCIAKENNNYKKGILKTLADIPNLQWYCNDCLQHTIDGVHVSVLRIVQSMFTSAIDANKPMQNVSPSETLLTQQATSTFSNASDLSDPAHSVIVNDENSSESTDTTVQTDSFLNNTSNDDDKMETCNSDNEAIVSTVSPDKSTLSNEIPSQKKRKRARSLSPSSSFNFNSNTSDITQKIALRPSKTSQLSDLVLDRQATVNNSSKLNTTARKSIYISPFLPETEPTDIIGHLNKNASIRDIIMSTNCIKLVSNKTKANKISFVSFKLEVPANDFEKFADVNLWPNGVTVKEFVDNKPAESSFVKPKNQRPYHHANRYRMNQHSQQQQQTHYNYHQQQKYQREIPVRTQNTEMGGGRSQRNPFAKPNPFANPNSFRRPTNQIQNRRNF